MRPQHAPPDSAITRLSLSAVAMLGTAIMLVACGGRQANPVAVTNDYDALLSCDHLRAEYDVNKRKIDGLRDEQRLESRTASGKSAAAPFLNDFKQGQSKEIAALRHRNAALENLMAERSCQN